jgi:MFS family permease
LRKLLSNILINRNYALFMGGSFFSATGTWFLSVSIGWLVWDIGRSEFLLGVAHFAQMGPMLALGLLGGVVSDRVDRRSLLRNTQIVWTVATGVLALASLLGIMTIPALLLPLIVIGVCQAFAWPSWSPFIADLVGHEKLRPAIAFNSARFNLTRIIGPALAGFLLARFGAGVCLALAAASQITLLVALAAIRTSPRPKVNSGPLFAAAREGIHHAWHTPTVRELIIAAAVMGVLVLPYVVFLPAYAEAILGVGPEGLGLLFTVVGLGAIAGAGASSTNWVATRTGAAQKVFTAITGIALATFALSTSPALSILALFILGLGSIAYLSTSNVTVQLAVPQAVVGRVIGIWVVVNAGTTPVGGVLLGALAERIGLPPTLAAAGIVATILSLIVLGRPRRLAKTTALKEEQASSGD